VRKADRVTKEPADAVVRKDRDDAALRDTVLSRTAIVWWAVAILAVGVGTAVWLPVYGGGDPRVQLDAIRTAGTVVVGAGGAALLLAARRQRSTEISLKQKERDQQHQERVAAAAEHDAAERRLTDLYVKAVEQLGSDSAAVRQGGLYALERVAQDNPAHRQTVVNVLCGYLRAPFTPPPAKPKVRPLGIRRPRARQTPATPEPGSPRDVWAATREEREVRLTA
jgi:hypothetical protein